MADNGTIYIHSHQVSGKCYVGQTWDYKHRTVGKSWSYKGSRHFYFSLQKYGWDAFDHQIVADGIQTQGELDNLERLWIILLRSCDRAFGYNMESGGSHGKASEETKKLLSKIHKDRPNSGRFQPGHPPTNTFGRPANSGSFKPGQFRGKPLPLEHRMKIAAGKKSWWDRQKGIVSA